MKRATLTAIAIFTLYTCPFQSPAQSSAPTVTQAPSGDEGLKPQRKINPPEPVTSKELREQMEKAQKAMREKQLKSDTERLLQLATELKASVDKANQNVLSLDVVRKAEQIEKLAKHIKTNMRDEAR